MFALRKKAVFLLLAVALAFTGSVTALAAPWRGQGWGICLSQNTCPNPDCPYEDCPYQGERPLDGTGMQYGKQGNGGNGAALSQSTCPNPDCPYQGERPLDGTGYRGGRGQRGCRA